MLSHLKKEVRAHYQQRNYKSRGFPRLFTYYLFVSSYYQPFVKPSFNSAESHIVCLLCVMATT